jgi:PAS domain S-box-containing protein
MKTSKTLQRLWKLAAPGFIVGVVFAAAAIYSGSHYVKQNYQTNLSETAQITTKGVASLVVERLNNYHQVLRSVANHHQDRILELAAGGGYPYDFNQISSELSSLFGNLRQFAIMDASGHTRLSSGTDALAEKCQGLLRQQIADWDKAVGVQLHQGHDGYHFDVMVTVRRGDDKAALCVSYSLQTLYRLLNQFDTPEFKLALVEANGSQDVVLSSSTLQEAQAKAFSAQQWSQVLAREAIAHTPWELVALPEEGMLNAKHRQVHLLAWGVFLVLLLTWIAFLYFLRIANEARFQAEKKASYSALFNAGPTVLFEKSYPDNMTIGYVSPNVLQLLGFRDSELMGQRSFYDLVHPEDLPEFKQAIEQAGNNEVSSFEMEYRLMCADWHYIWVYSLVHLNRNHAGQVQKIQGYITSIQAQKLAEQQAITLIENAPDAMVVTDTQGRIQSLNKMAEQLFDYHKDGMVALSMSELVPSYGQALEALLDSGMTSQQECLGHTKTGRQLTLAMSLSYLRTTEGGLVASVIRDISLQKAAQEQMRQAKERAESLAKARSQFVAMISHEIRTPMNGVLGMADLLSETRLNEQQSGYVEAIRESGRSLVSILNDVLDFSKLEQGHIRLRQEPFQLQEVVNHCIRLLMPQAKLGGVSIQQSFDLVCPQWLLGDALRLRQILLNLLGNAIKFSPKGQVHLNVAVLKHSGSDLEMQFSIQDNGIGIAQEYQKVLFEPFTQVDNSSSRHFGGTGLGLAITKQLVDLMGGQIQLVSELHQGSTFIVTLPFAESHPLMQAESEVPLQLSATAKSVDIDKPSPEVHAVTPDRANKGLKKVLLVEDDLINQQIAEAFLAKLGLQVEVVNNGLEALDFWRMHQGEFGLILMDCQMPVMDGYEASRLIRQEEALMKPAEPSIIIAFTANAYKEDEQRCLAAGMNDFMVKPLFMEQFSAMIYKWFPEAKDLPPLQDEKDGD